MKKKIKKKKVKKKIGKSLIKIPLIELKTPKFFKRKFKLLPKRDSPNIFKKIGYFSKFKDKFFPENSYLICMELRNGFHTNFLINTSENTFKYKGCLYIIDPDIKYFNTLVKLWCLDFHQDFCLPIHRAIPLIDIKKAVTNHDSVQNMEYATNPKTLEQFVTSEIAKGVMQGQAIDSFLKTMKILIWVILIVVCVHMFIYFNQAGVLKMINIG